MRSLFWFLTNEFDDVVTLGIKAFCFVMSLCVILWLVSLVMVMIQINDHDSYFSINAFAFIPMWIGTSIAVASTIYISCNVCRNATLVSRERRDWMRELHIESDLEFIDYDSLPLCRKLFFLSLTLGVTTTVLLISQIIFYLWFGGVIDDVWDAMNPVIGLLLVYQVYMYLMAFFSLRSCILYSLVLLQIIVFTLRATNEISASWLIVSLPIILALIIFVYVLMSIFIKVMSGRYQLTVLQKISFTGYGATFCLSITALYYLADASINHGLAQSIPMVVPILWTSAIVVFVLSGLLILNVEGWRLSVTRGYYPPVPLELGSEGWTAVSSLSATATQDGVAVGEDTLWLGRVSLGRLPHSYRQLLDQHISNSSTNAKIVTVAKLRTDAADPLRDELDVMEPLDTYIRDSYQNSAVEAAEPA